MTNFELDINTKTYGVCETTISDGYVVVGTWLYGGSIVHVSLKGEKAFTMFGNYDIRTLEDFKVAFIDFVEEEIKEGRL